MLSNEHSIVFAGNETLTFSKDKSPPSMALNGYSATTIVTRCDASCERKRNLLFYVFKDSFSS